MLAELPFWWLSRTNGAAPHSLGAYVYCCCCEELGTRRSSSLVSVSVSQGPILMLGS